MNEDRVDAPERGQPFGVGNRIFRRERRFEPQRSSSIQLRDKCYYRSRLHKIFDLGQVERHCEPSGRVVSEKTDSALFSFHDKLRRSHLAVVVNPEIVHLHDGLRCRCAVASGVGSRLHPFQMRSLRTPDSMPSESGWKSLRRSRYCVLPLVVPDSPAFGVDDPRSLQTADCFFGSLHAHRLRFLHFVSCRSRTWSRQSRTYRPP